MNESSRPPIDPIPDLSSEPLSPPPMGDVALEPGSTPRPPKSPTDGEDDNEDDQTRAGN